ncbi:MAG: 5-amino-6-(D-ribitylamino)uracil--L-tyrosine 4-hydroxyphenyl transferase CofH [Acidimicrobiales bacterium]
MAAEDLIGARLDDLMAEAVAIRRAAFGSIVTYSPKVFIPFTRLCRDRCAYCTFVRSPSADVAPYLSDAEVLAVARSGVEAGCHEALFTLGEAPEDRWPSARGWLDDHGYASTVEALAHACRLVISETGLLPHANAGALGPEELARLRGVSVSQGMMLESIDSPLACHRGCPDKHPVRRLATLEAAGESRVPFTTGLLVGIGDSRSARISALEAITDSHRRHGHIQEVIIQNFRPHAATVMRSGPACPDTEHLWTLAVARMILPPQIHLQAPPNLAEDVGRLLDAGIDDLGGISPVTPDHVNPSYRWPTLHQLEVTTGTRGLELVPRLAIYPEFLADADRWVDESLRPSVIRRSDATGLGRDSSWTAGSPTPPPRIITVATRTPGAQNERIAPRHRSAATGASGALEEVIEGVRAGQQVGHDEIVTLFGARGRQVNAVAELADDLRRAAVGEAVTWVANRNINYTNVCTFRCGFCAFSKGPLSLSLRGNPYLLSRQEIADRVAEAHSRGATEVCLQGGIHPSFDGEYYLDVCRAVTDAAPGIHIHGFTALEVSEGARRLGEPLLSYLTRLRQAGLASLPGTAAEILDDEVRAHLCPDKIGTEEWLEVHRTAHSVGLRSNVTIMFGSMEGPASWARHLLRTRDLQAETGGFTEFVPLPFVHMAAPIWLAGKARCGPTFREALLMHAVGRIAYRGFIDHIQVSWVKMGTDGSRQALMAGADDLGGTLMNENISRAAGAEHGQEMATEDFAAIVEPLDRPLAQRTTLYRTVGEPVGV